MSTEVAITMSIKKNRYIQVIEIIGMSTEVAVTLPDRKQKYVEFISLCFIAGLKYIKIISKYM